MFERNKKAVVYVFKLENLNLNSYTKSKNQNGKHQSFYLNYQIFNPL